MLEESMYASGKINVVLAVVGVVLLGLFVYMFIMERRLRKLEKKSEAR